MSRVSSIENNLEVIRNRRKKHEENSNADQEFREGRISYSDFLKNQEKYGSGDPGITGSTTDEVEPKERSQKYWAWQQENNALLDEFNEYEGTGRYQTQKQHDDYYKRLKTQLGKAVTMRKSDAYYNDEIDEAVDQLSKAIQSNTKGREYYKKWDDEESYQQDKKQKEEEYQSYLQKMKEQEEAAKRAEEYKQYLDNLKNQDMDSLQTQLKDTNDKLNNVWGAYDFDALRDKKTELKSAILEKQKEEAAAEKEKISAQYENLRNSEDFGEKSQYQSTASDRPTVLARLTGNDAWGVNHDIGDEEYEYINNENLRDEIKNKYSTYGNDTGNRSSKYERLGYDYVSDEEKQIYNYLYSTKGKKDAEKYLDSLDLTARMTEDYGERFADVTRRHPIAASALSVPMGIQSGLGFVKDTADFISGKGIDEHSYYNLNANMQNKIRDTVSEEIQKAVEGTWGEAGSASYGIGMSMADYLATTAITGGNSALSLAIMGSRAAAQGVIDAKERGVSDTQAFLTGAAQGIAEIAFEKISLEQLKYFHQQGASDIAGVIKNILKGSFTEGSEEFFTSVANAITDGLINGGMSEIDTNIDQYMQNGHTAEDAKKLATEDFVKQLGMDFIGGAVSGGIMSGVATGLNYGQEGTLPENPTNVQPGSEVAPAQNQEVKVDVPEGTAPVRETSTNYKQHMVDVALENGKISDSYADTIRDDAEMKAALEEKTGVSIEGTEAEQRNTIKALVETYARTQGTGAGATETNGKGINEEVQGADRKTGEWAPQDEQIRKMAELAGDGDSQEVSENFLKNYNGNLEAEDYAKAYDLFYSAGKNGVTLSDAMRSGNMFAEVAGTQAMKDAWNMGLKARNAQDQQIQLMRKQQEKAGQGLYVDEVMEDGPMKELQKAVAEKTGIDITRVRSLPHDANGMFIPSMMSMVLSTNGTNEYTSMIHELGEFGLTYDRAGMKSVQDAMIQWWAGKNGVEGLSDMNELVSEYQKRYEKAEGSKTNSQAMDEMINDAMGGLFSSDQGVEEFVNWVQKDSGMESGKQKTVLQNMADILKSLVDSIKNILSGSRLTKAAKTALQMEEDQATKIRQRFLEVIDRASENAQTKGEYVSEKQVNYELKGTDEDGVEVYETSDDVKNLTLKERKAKLLDTMINQYKGRTAKFTRDGETYYAQYNNKGINKGIFGDKKSDMSGLKAKVNIGADGNYIELAENALYSGSAKESGKSNKFHRDAKTWDYYVKTIRSDGKDYDVLINVKNTEKDHYVYDITLRKKSTTPFVQQLNPHLSSGADASTNNIASQVKSVNEETKFSLKEEVEETKDLIAVHNLNEENLLKTLKLGSFPMPSIAITKTKMGHNGFGDISVVFGKETIDPANKKNKVYGADAWTPTFPRIENSVNEDVYYRVLNKIQADMKGTMPEYLEQEAKRFVSTRMGNAETDGMDGVVKAAKYSTAMKAAFLADQGIEVEDRKQQIQKANISPETESLYKSLLKSVENSEELEKVVNSDMPLKEIRDDYGAELANAFAKAKIEDGMEPQEAYKRAYRMLEKGFLLANMIKKFQGAFDYQKNGIQYSTETVRDTDGIKQEIDSQVDESEYESWIRKLYDGLVEGQGVPNNKDPFTSSGRKRSFQELHYDVTPEGIVKSMLSQGNGDGKNVSGFQGIKTVRAAASSEFDSIADIHSSEGRIQNLTEEQFDDNLNKLSNRLTEAIASIVKRTGATGVTAADNVGEIVVEAAGKKRFSENVLRKTFEKYPYWKVSEQEIAEIANIINETREMPVNLFEAKPQRTVGFDEIKAIVMPENEALTAKLHEAGIENIVTYDGTETDRLQKLNNLEDVQFSLPEENEDLRRKNENLVRENEKYRTVIQDLRARIGANEPLTTQISQKSIDRIVNGIYKDFKSSYDKGTFKSKLSAFLNDVASGKAESRDNFTYMAEQILRPVIEESQNNLELSDYAKDVLKDIRETKISLDSVQKEEVANAFGSYNEFRKATFGRLSLSNEGVPLDSMWQEWSARYPELFDGNMNSADQANALADIVSNLKEDYVNDYGFSIEDATSFAAAELMEEYENLPEIRKLDKGKDSIDFRIKYRRLINEIKNEYKASYENQIKELKQENIETRRDMSEQMERQKAKMRERQRETREQRRVNEIRKKYRNRIEKNTKTMLRWFENNTEKQHIPEVLKKPAAEFLTSLNFLHSNGDYNSNENIQLKLRLNDLFRSLSGMGDGDADFINRMDPDLLPMMNEYLTESGDTSVPELETKQMEKLDFIVNSLKETVTKANKLYQNALYEDAYQAGADTISQLQSRKMKNDKSGLVGMADRLLNTEMLDPYSYFRRMGKAGFSVYKEIRNGFNERTWKLQKAQNFMEETLNGQKIKKWTGKNATLHEVQIGQEKVKLTTGQIMNLYVLAQRPQALTHLTAKGGGFTITDLTNSQKRAERVLRVTSADIDIITDLLTPEQKQVAGKMQKFLAQECADWGNEVSMKMYGYKKFGEKTYWPIQTNDNFGKAKNMEQKGNQSSLYAIRNQGMTKSLVKNASNPIVVGDIFDVFTDHVCNMANYNAFTVPLSDAMVWYNHQNRTDTGIAMESVREEMERAFGRGAKSYFINLIKDVNGEVTKGYGSEISDSFTGRYKAAAVGANLRVVIQQPTAYMRAMAVMDPKYLMKAAMMKPAIKESQDNSAIAKWKSWGYFETGIGQSMKNVLTDQATPLEKMTEASMWAAGKADDITWGVLWNAVKAEVQDQNPGIDVKSEEYLKLVQDRFDDVVDQTQVVDTVLHRSQIMRSSNGAVKMATSFMAEPTKSFNLLRTRMTEVAASMYQDKLRGVKNSKATKAARKDLARSVVSLGLTAVATSAASAIIDGVRDDDDDKDYMEKWMDSFVANMADNTNIFGQIPYVKEVFSMVQGYDSERMDMAGISNLITSAQEAYKYANGDSKKTMYGVIKGVVRGLSQVLGVPAYNTLREIESIHNAVAKEPWDTKKLTKKTALARLDKAAQNGDEDLQKKYLQYLSDEYDKKKEQELANGKKAEDAAKAARSALMNSVTSYFKPLYQAGNTQEKIRIKNLIFKIGVDGKQLYKNYDWKSWDKKD
jgi:hypothetical protein